MGVLKHSSEFKDEAIRQVTEKGRSVSDVAAMVGVTSWTIYSWLRAAGVPKPSDKKQQTVEVDLAKENAALRSQIKRLEEERDILKKAAAYFAKESR